VSAFLSAYGLFLAEVLTLVAIVILIVLLIAAAAMAPACTSST